MVTCLSTEACECHYQMLPIPVLRWALSFQIDRNTRHRETLNARRIHSTNDKELTDHAWFRSPCFCTMKNLPPLLWGCNAPAIPLYKKNEWSLESLQLLLWPNLAPNRPRLSYQYYNMAPRLGYKENNTKYRSLSRKPRNHVRILIYWACSIPVTLKSV